MNPKFLFEGPERLGWRDFFRTLKRPFTGFAALAVVLIVILICFLTRKWDFLINALIGLATGIPAALIATQWYRDLDDRPAQKKLEYFRSLAPPEYLQSLVTQLDEFRGLHCEAYRAAVNLSIHPTYAELFVCRIHYEYIREVQGGTRYITFRRLVRGIKASPPAHTEAYLRDLFDFENDERDFPELESLADAYVVEGFAFDEKSVELVRHQSPDHLRVAFSAELPSLHRAVKVEFNVKFPVERESVVAILNEYPTKAMTVEFDFEDVQSLIKPHAQLFFADTTRVNPNITASSWKYVHNEWVLPKNGVVFTWWRQ